MGPFRFCFRVTSVFGVPWVHDQYIGKTTKPTTVNEILLARHLLRSKLIKSSIFKFWFHWIAFDDLVTDPDERIQIKIPFDLVDELVDPLDIVFGVSLVRIDPVYRSSRFALGEFTATIRN